MRIAYMPDTHFGTYDQRIPGSAEVARAGEHLLDEAELAEDVGFDGIWLPERHARPETFFPSVVVLLGALAARTRSVDLATTVMQPTYHHPVHLAEQLAQIDQLSKGRLIFGAGVGYHADYFRLFGVPVKARGARFEECLEVISGLWTHERFSFKGRFFELDDVLLTPKPYQRPRPPIWIGAFEPKAIERALAWDGWVLWFPPSVEETLRRVEPWREKAEKLGKKNWKFAVAYEGWIGDDEAAVRRLHGHRWVREMSFYRSRGLSSDVPEVPVEELEDQFLILGGPQQWIDRLGEVAERLRPDYVCIRTRNPRSDQGHYPSPEESLECIQRLGEEVVRVLHKQW
ncbi:MAG: LLM class flavin-dependent oxidoreductase [Deltaproteobacteria bacterium]|nr:LLM class flavin-dependent oxidoreductase [Deltaproteobacteria bacterium]